MKLIHGLLIMSFLGAGPLWAQEQQSASDIIAQLKIELDLSEEQVTNISPIIQKYFVAFHDLQQSIDQGTINPSAIDSQTEGIKAAETQELSQYLKPYQLSQWRAIQNQLVTSPQEDQDDTEKYSNLPKENQPQE